MWETIVEYVCAAIAWLLTIASVVCGIVGIIGFYQTFC